jgi:capsule polysaccharide export protein KpsE/RkpR
VRLASDDLLAAIHALPAARIDAATRERLLAVKARIEAVL